MNKCQQCGEPAQTTLCKTCAKHMRRQASSLAKTIPELRALAERKAHIGERGGGVRGGEPGLPVSVHWLEVYEEAARLMLRVAAGVSGGVQVVVACGVFAVGRRAGRSAGQDAQARRPAFHAFGRQGDCRAMPGLFDVAGRAAGHA